MLNKKEARNIGLLFLITSPLLRLRSVGVLGIPSGPGLYCAEHIAKPFNSHQRQSSLPLSSLHSFYSVGVLGIEPSLPVPKTGVLPVYDTPRSITRAYSMHNFLYFVNCKVYGRDMV